VVSWSDADLGFTEALCDLEIRLKLTVPAFPFREECIPPVPAAPELTGLEIQTDGNDASLFIWGAAAPNTFLDPYVGDDCQTLLSDFLLNIGIQVDFEILTGPDPEFEIELPLPSEVIPFLNYIQIAAPLWTAKSRDMLGQVSPCSDEAIELFVNSD